MNNIKRWFVMPYLLLCLVAIIHCSIQLILGLVQGNPAGLLPWLGALIAIAPMVGFMMWLGFAGVSGTSRYLPLQLSCAWVGSALALYSPNFWPTTYALVLGFIGVHAYVFWYSRLDRTGAPILKTGADLPPFSLLDSGNAPINSEAFLGSPTLLMFYRGNWCPLCVAQVKEIAAQYQELASRGVKVVVVSPQPAEQSRQLAERFKVPMRFAVDQGGKAARLLGIFHAGGVPAGLKGYDADSVYPTVVLTDENNHVVWADLTDNYRVRPGPAEYLEKVDALLGPAPQAVEA